MDQKSNTVHNNLVKQSHRYSPANLYLPTYNTDTPLLYTHIFHSMSVACPVPTLSPAQWAVRMNKEVWFPLWDFRQHRCLMVGFLFLPRWIPSPPPLRGQQPADRGWLAAARLRRGDSWDMSWQHWKVKFLFWEWDMYAVIQMKNYSHKLAILFFFFFTIYKYPVVCYKCPSSNIRSHTFNALPLI